ncbi:hypothetical protein [Aliarcobacter skirrowii]|uniref:Membrane protein n=1 Tax=Aliarcobacter skirrowii CCUG 10374 TaxID=1032239 RepID=A0AAD0SML7_9BACT|nr:hypothetical protein [Aliarcobacter skirrowii]AXX84946.1 putative membrane protein [Aliarcobacter skirrowii CCUG 10374]KAB0620517.1 hypothetical protein F7P70_07965 [Aliarcobacter skirrowii CCUG 10374]RXI25710.1 hypothetical protein CP959_07990 [Aliarcobacter skirrowii CCUG 10374]SUU96531.1 Uncharacterised protein [Aliarcobacter skirrowii]
MNNYKKINIEDLKSSYQQYFKEYKIGDLSICDELKLSIDKEQDESLLYFIICNKKNEILEFTHIDCIKTTKEEDKFYFIISKNYKILEDIKYYRNQINKDEFKLLAFVIPIHKKYENIIEEIESFFIKEDKTKKKKNILGAKKYNNILESIFKFQIFVLFPIVYSILLPSFILIYLSDMTNLPFSALGLENFIISYFGYLTLFYIAGSKIILTVLILLFVYLFFLLEPVYKYIDIFIEKIKSYFNKNHIIYKIRINRIKKLNNIKANEYWLAGHIRMFMIIFILILILLVIPANINFKEYKNTFIGKTSEFFFLTNNKPEIVKYKNQNILYLGADKQRFFYINLGKNISINKNTKDNYVLEILDKYKNRIESKSLAETIDYLNIEEQNEIFNSLMEKSIE